MVLSVHSSPWSPHNHATATRHMSRVTREMIADIHIDEDERNKEEDDFVMFLHDNMLEAFNRSCKACLVTWCISK